jgi:hypothetical protein
MHVGFSCYVVKINVLFQRPAYTYYSVVHFIKRERHANANILHIFINGVNYYS